MVEVVRVAWPWSSILVTPPNNKCPPPVILILPVIVEVPAAKVPVPVAFVNVMFANDDEVFTVNTVIEEVVNDPCPRLSILVTPPV